MAGSPLRAGVRLALYLALTLSLLPVQVAAVAARMGLAKRLPLFYHRLCCWVLGFRVEARGERAASLATLYVSNHVSYTDIMVLGALIPGSFVAKAEVASWPLFGLLAKLQRSVFIDRRGVRAAEHRDRMTARLAAGDDLILFPEGTSGDGNRVLPFRSALFAAASLRLDDAPVPVQPVTIAYTKLDGMPVGRLYRPLFAWYGGMGMLGHLLRLLALGTVTVEVRFHPPVTIDQFASRRALADHCRGVIAAALAAANSGRAPPAPLLDTRPAGATVRA